MRELFPEILEALKKNQFEDRFGLIVASQNLPVSSLHTLVKLKCVSGDSFILKFNPNVASDMFRSEAKSLAVIRESQTIRVPNVLGVDAHYILMEDLGNSSINNHFWELLAFSLSQMHQIRAEYFGFECDNYCGLSKQRNTLMKDGYEFYIQCRIIPQTEMAFNSHLLDKSDVKHIDTLLTKIKEIIPEQAPRLIHGDLWQGNIHACDDESAAIIDPASYYGWTEAELSMTCLFGRFSPRFYAVYAEHYPILKDWHKRINFYNIYHLLNHLNLFGRTYYSQLKTTIASYL